MCKNVILNTAIDAALDLPRKALWTATAVTVVFSLEAGLTIIGDTLDLKAGGTSPVYAAAGLLANKNVANASFVGSMGGVEISVWASALASTTDPLEGATVGGTGSEGQVIYASELFRGTPPSNIPSGTGHTNDFQAICYEVPGVYSTTSTVTIDFKITGASFDNGTGNWIFGFGNVLADDAAGCDGSTTSVAAASAKLTINPASCSLADGAQLCLAYKLASTSALKDPGKTVTISAEIKKGATVVGLASPITVAESAQGANFTLKPESGGLVYITAASGNKEFSSTDIGGAFLSATEVKIGYVEYSSGNAKSTDGSNSFTIGTDTADVATLVIDNGQFSASPAGASQGKVYLKELDATAAITVTGANQTATWNLNNTQLNALTTAGIATIAIRVDGQTEIKDTEGGEDPTGTLTVTMGTAKTSVSDAPIVSALRRIPYDGKVCKVFNIPSPDGAADVLSLRITNDSDQLGKITGTLYNEAGEALGEVLDLLGGHIDYTKNPPLDRATLGLADPLQLQPRETVILTSKNIATIFGQTSWPEERWVLEIQSTIPKIEVFNLLRNVQDITYQPLSNVSAGADGVECSPIP